MNGGYLDWFLKYNIESNWKQFFKLCAMLSFNIIMHQSQIYTVNVLYILNDILNLKLTFLIGVHETLPTTDILTTFMNLSVSSP